MKIIAHVLLINFDLFSRGRQEEPNENELDYESSSSAAKTHTDDCTSPQYGPIFICV